MDDTIADLAVGFGCDFIKTAYQEAIKNEYRFFSYGDSMFIENRI